MAAVSLSPFARAVHEKKTGEEPAEAEAEEADSSRGPRPKRSGGTGRGKIETGEPIEGMIGWS